MKIFLSEPIDKQTYHILKTRYQVIDNINHIDECEIIISRNLKINQSFIDQCLSLKLIIIHGSGYDDVDIDYLKVKGIHLCHTPGHNSASVAELIVLKMLELSRCIPQLHYHQVKEIAPASYLGHDIAHKTCGLIGFGDITKKVTQILQDGFSMKMMVYSRSLTQQDALEYGVMYCQTMDEIFMTADYVVIGLPLNDDTYHLIDYHYLSMMKPTSYLINCARGAIVDEDALYELLKTQKIAGAGIDVVDGEPIDDNHPLLTLDNVVYTPHIGGSTYEALERIGQHILLILQQYQDHTLTYTI